MKNALQKTTVSGPREPRSSRRVKILFLVSFVVLSVFSAGAGAFGGGQPDLLDARMKLGLRLFREERFSAPEGDLTTACSSCHLYNEDPQGIRAQTDFFNRSWIPWRTEDPRRAGPRNAPTILDAAAMPRLHFDGEFGSLDELVKGTLTGRTMGWLTGEENKARTRIKSIIVNDAGTRAPMSYKDQFKQVFNVDVSALSEQRILELVSEAMVSYLETLKSQRNAPYDKFIQANQLDAAPKAGEDAKAFATRLLQNIQQLESKGKLKFVGGFNKDALKGMKLFFTVEGTATANCAACHTPPLFTDHLFRNMGVSQAHYDDIHGEGSFAALEIPDAKSAVRPIAKLRDVPSRQKPGEVDLGYWNFVNLKGSTQRRANESDDQFLTRMIGTIKTPTLRNLDYSAPYFHTGDVVSLEDALNHLKEFSEMARVGKVRSPDDELARIRITDRDIPLLINFLKTLNEDIRANPTVNHP